MKTIRFIFLTALLSFAVLPQRAMACATCFGQSDEAMAKGMNMGILALLICIVGVLLAMVGVGIFFARRASRLAMASGPNNPAHFGLPAGHNLK